MMRIIVSDPMAGADGDRLWVGSRYRPFLGISVSSKPLPLATAVKILEWCLRAQCTVLPILIADELAYITYRALSHYSGGGAMRRARRDGDRHIESWREALDHVSKEQAERVRFVRWPELVSPLYLRQVEVVREEFERGEELHGSIHALVEIFAGGLGKQLNPKRALALAEYIIQEIPCLLFGIQMDGIQYQMSVYPTASPTPLMPLIVALQKEPRFAEMREKLSVAPLEYNTLVEIILTEHEPTKETTPTFRLKPDFCEG